MLSAELLGSADELVESTVLKGSGLCGCLAPGNTAYDLMLVHGRRGGVKTFDQRNHIRIQYYLIVGF